MPFDGQATRGSAVRPDWDMGGSSRWGALGREFRRGERGREGYFDTRTLAPLCSTKLEPYLWSRT